MGMFNGLKHLEFAGGGVQTFPLFIPWILNVLQASPPPETLFIETCCILPDPQYVCTVATLPNLRSLRVTWDAVSKVLHLVEVPSSVNIEIARSFFDVTEPGANVLSCLHANLPWIDFLYGARTVTVLNTDVMSVEMKIRQGGATPST